MYARKKANNPPWLNAVVPPCTHGRRRRRRARTFRAWLMEENIPQKLHNVWKLEVEEKERAELKRLQEKYVS